MPKGGFALGVEIRPDAVFAAVLDLCGTTIGAERAPLPATDRATITGCVTDLCDAGARGLDTTAAPGSSAPAW